MIRTIDGKEYSVKITRKGLRAAESQGMNYNELTNKPISLLYFLWYAGLYGSAPMPFDKSCDLLDAYLDDENCPETMTTLLESLSEDFDKVFA